MEYIYKNISVNYIYYGKGEETLVFLHGWGGNISSFYFFAKRFEKKYKILILDFPPFGKSEEPKEVWTVEDYSQMLFGLTELLNLQKITIISHSFGGRVAIFFASSYTKKVNKLVLVASAGLKPKFNLVTKLKIWAYKLAKKLKLKFAKNMGSKELKELSPIMKKTFVKIVNEDLTKNAKSIKAETLLVWGNKDKATPLYMGKKLKKIIPKSKLIVLKDLGHFAYVEKINATQNIIEAFLKG